MYEKNFPTKRYNKTLDFVKQHISVGEKILDLGITNPLSKLLQKSGFTVANTTGEDLDVDFSAVLNSNAEVVTAFEIFEHLVTPFSILKEIKANKLVASVPLRLWFSAAYRSKTDLRDRHFHEFEDWQFDWLLEKAGWHIVDKKKWTNPTNKIGIRPILRRFTPRYYIVYAERK